MPERPTPRQTQRIQQQGYNLQRVQQQGYNQSPGSSQTRRVRHVTNEARIIIKQTLTMN